MGDGPPAPARDPRRARRGTVDRIAACDRALEHKITRAANLEQTDRVGANSLWTQLDREITNRALWVPLFNGYQADLVSKRVGNYQYNPMHGAVLSQLWVR